MLQSGGLPALRMMMWLLLELQTVVVAAVGLLGLHAGVEDVGVRPDYFELTAVVVAVDVVELPDWLAVAEEAVDVVDAR